MSLRTRLHPSRTWALRACRAAWLGLRLAVVLGVITLTIVWRGFGYVPIVVQSGSMEPQLPVGSMLFVQPTTPADVREGDVITFDPPGAPMRTTHRVVDIDVHDGKHYFVTRGDANESDDDWRRSGDRQTSDEPWARGVSYGDNDALVTRAHVPWIGYVTLLAARGWFRIGLIALACVWAALIAVRWIWSTPTDRRGTPVVELDEPAEERRHERAA